jgi:tetratricopeptide (TPR) repeat protein/O-antigen ligase
MTNAGAVLRRFWQDSRFQGMVWFFLLLVPAASRLSYGDPTNQYLTLGIYTVLAGGWIALVVRRRLPILVPKFLLALFAYAALMVVLLPLSPVRSHAWEILSDIAQFCALAIAVFTVFPKVLDPKPLEGSLISLGVLFSLANLVYVGIALGRWLEVALRYSQFPPFGYRLPGAFLGHPNIEAGFLALLLPFVLVRSLEAGQTRGRLLGFGLLGFFIFIDFFTSSRAGWAAAAAGLAASGILWLASRRQGKGMTHQIDQMLDALHRRWLISLGVAGIGIALLALVWLQLSNTGHQPLAQARTGVWSAGLAIFLASPIFGHGPGSTHLLVMTADRFVSEPYFIHPHNVVLYLVDEGGLVALLIALVGGLMLVRFLWNAHGRFPPHEMALEAAGIGALAAVAVHSQADVPFEAPVYAIAVLLIFVVVWSRRLSEHPRALVSIPSGIVFALIAGCLLGQLLLLRGVSEIKQGVDLFVAGEHDAAAKVLCRGAGIRDNYAVGHFQCALASGEIASLQGNPDDLRQSITEFQTGLNLDPFWPANWANLGSLLWEAGQREAALKALSEAIARAPDDPRFLVTKGWMLETSGAMPEAKRAYEMAVQLNPSLAQSIYLQGSDTRRQSVLDVSSPEFRSRTQQLTTLGWTQLNMQDYPSALKSFQSALELTPRSPAARIGLATVYQALGQSEEARMQADFALLEQPAEARVLLAAGQIAYEQGLMQQSRAWLLGGWKLIKNRNESVRYYGIVYRRAYLPFDELPGLIDPRLTSDMAKALQTLGSIATANGETELANEIEAYLSGQEGRLP